ncbi:hypothetical protein HZC30_02520 [Candidatus Woesearchaeota archaeon]|nr:hypothetical protein [Candidatus Woesearchaeota archaeon]
MSEREGHMCQVERWALFVKENPAKWKKQHTEFINAIFDKHEQFRETMLNTPTGKDKLVKLYDIRNKKGYSWLK